MCLPLVHKRLQLFHDPGRVIVRPWNVKGLSVLTEVELSFERAIAFDNRGASEPSLVGRQSEPHRKFDSAQNNASGVFVRELLRRVWEPVQKGTHLTEC